MIPGTSASCKRRRRPSVSSEFKVLIVEDSPDKANTVRAQISERVRDLNPEFEIAKGLIDSVKILETTYFDMVIS